MKAAFAPSLVALALVAAACPADPGHEVATDRSRAGGALAIASDDSELYAADADNDELVVIDPVKQQVKARVKVGRWPERAVVNADGRVLVSNRHDRSVSVVDPKAAKEVGRIKVGAEPVGLALTGDGRLLVANHTSNTLSVVDLRTLKETKQVATRPDPTGVTVVPGGKAYVSHARTGEVSVFDLEREAFQTRAISLALTPDRIAFEERLPNSPADPVFNPEDGRVYVPHQQSKLTPTETTIENPDAYAGGGGPVAITVTAAALATVDATTDSIVDAPGIDLKGMGDCFDCGVPGMAPRTTDAPAVIQQARGPLSGPSAVAVEPSGQWMFITNLNSNNVSIVSTKAREFAFEPVKVGAGPNGVVVTRDGDKAYVYNSFDHTISVLEAAGRSSIVASSEFKVGVTSLTPEQDVGRRLFFAADDARMTNSKAGGVACASCHPGGRDDGRTWLFTEGPRNTPLLAGRNLRDSAPYHWDGLLEDMHAFKLVVETRMGGTGTQGFGPGNALTADDFDKMMAYLDALPGPDNPYRGETLSPAQARGKALFESEAVGCAECHAGATLQDGKEHDVGTTVPDEHFPKDGKVNTPSLHGIFASAPYLHNGQDRTLEDRIRRNPGDLHGKTTHLTEGQVNDLVEYLKSL